MLAYIVSSEIHLPTPTPSPQKWTSPAAKCSFIVSFILQLTYIKVPHLCISLEACCVCHNYQDTSQILSYKLHVLHRSHNHLHQRLHFSQSSFACKCCFTRIRDSHNKTTRDVKFKLFSSLSLFFQADVNRYNLKYTSKSCIRSVWVVFNWVSYNQNQS